MKEKLVGQEESFRKKVIDFDAEVLSLRKANAELEVNYDLILFFATRTLMFGLTNAVPEMKVLNFFGCVNLKMFFKLFLSLYQYFRKSMWTWRI